MAKAKKLPSGSWRVQASITLDGNLIRRSFTAASKDKAELLAKEWQVKQEELSSPENITFSEALKRYIESKENVLSPSTIKAYRSMRKTYFAGIKHIKIDKITSEQIQREINILAASKSAKTVRNAHGFLSAVFEMFRPGFSLHTTLPQKTERDIVIPGDETVSQIISIVKDTKLELPVLLAAFGPLRRGEICATTTDKLSGNILTVNETLVKTSDNKWVLKQPKTLAGFRKIELPNFIAEKFKKFDGRIYAGTPDSLTLAFKKMLKKNNIPPFRFHDLRHYNVSILHALNVPDKYIMARGGWKSNYVMNNVYNHVLKEKTNEFNVKITEHFEKVIESNSNSTSHGISHES